MITRLVSLILTDDLRGGGSDGSPYRRVTQLWTPRGVLVAEADSWNDSNGFASGPSFFRPTTEMEQP